MKLNNTPLEDLCQYDGRENERRPLEEIDREITAKINLLFQLRNDVTKKFKWVFDNGNS